MAAQAGVSGAGMAQAGARRTPEKALTPAVRPAPRRAPVQPRRPAYWYAQWANLAASSAAATTNADDTGADEEPAETRATEETGGATVRGDASALQRTSATPKCWYSGRMYWKAVTAGAVTAGAVTAGAVTAGAVTAALLSAWRSR